MTLDAQRMLNRTVSCISGSFVADMTPCAPNGEFGLSYPTGSASLSKIVNHWQDYGDHLGGVVSYTNSPQSISFSGGFMSDSYKPEWSFTANRLTGTAKLVIEKGQDEAGQYEYVCGRAMQKF